MNIEREARRTLARIANAGLATAARDGTPWNSAVYFAFDGRAFYWSSHRDAVHSRNIAANPSVFLLVFDSTADDDSGHGVYSRACARELTTERSIEIALGALAQRRGQSRRPTADFMGDHPRRMYEAVPETCWTNIVRQRDDYYYDERVLLDLGPGPSMLDKVPSHR
jgi:hypothetical protein